MVSSAQKQEIASRLARYTKIENICWIVLGVLQILSIIGIFAGIWNVIGGILGFAEEKRILKRDKRVPIEAQKYAMIIIFGIINIFLGGVLGIGIVVYWIWIRQEILKNKDIFDGQGSGCYSEGGFFAVAPVSPENNDADSFQKLEKCVKLYEKGIITKEEFEEQKKKLLASEPELSAEDELTTKMKKLSSLHQKGILTKAEFEEQRKKLLDEYL